MITFTCPGCGQEYKLEDSWKGAKVSCARCDMRFRVPNQDGEVGMSLPPPQTKTESSATERPTQEAESTTSSRPAGSKIVISFDDSGEIHCASAPSEPRKLSPRQRRLASDYQMMVERFSTFPHIRLVSTEGNPPEKYVVDFHVKGIERLDGDRVVYRMSHRAEIILPGTYPRTPPTCRMLTPIFHPNIEPAVICIGDHWTAAERLCDLVVRIGEIITYQSYNIKSPLDGEAAMWADLHEDMLPIDSCDLMPPEA